MEWDDPSRTYDYLIGIIDRHLDQEAEKRNRVNLDRAIGHSKPGTAAPSAAKDVCKKFLAGTCTKKWNECKYEHPRGKEGSKPTATHGGGTASGGAAPRGKSKTVGRDKSPARGQDRGRSPSVRSRAGKDVIDKSKLPCRFFQTGNCTRSPPLRV